MLAGSVPPLDGRFSYDTGYSSARLYSPFRPRTVIRFPPKADIAGSFQMAVRTVLPRHVVREFDIYGE